MEPFAPIDTARLRLRCLSSADAMPLSQMMTPGVSSWVASWPSPFTLEMAAARIETVRRAASEGRAMPLAVVERDTGATVSYVGVFRDAKKLQRAILGYLSGEDYQGRGIMREAAPAAVGVAFLHLAVDEIEAHARPENAASLAVLRRCGMMPRGERSIYVPARQREELCLVYAIKQPVDS